MLITKEEFYKGIDEKKYCGMFEFDAFVLCDFNVYVSESIDCNEFFNEKFIKQSNYEFIWLSSGEYDFHEEDYYRLENIRNAEEYKKYYKEHMKDYENREKYMEYCQKNNIKFSWEKYQKYLDNIDYKMKNEENSENEWLVMLIPRNDKDLFSILHTEIEDYGFKDEGAISFFMHVAKILLELKYDECVDFACIMYKLINNESPFSMKDKDLNSNQEEVFYKARDFLNVIENFDENKYKLLFEFLAKNITPDHFKKKSVMFTENQIEKINSIGGKGFSENLRFIVNEYFNDFKKAEKNYSDDSQLNKIISSIIISFSTKVGLYTKNINEREMKFISNNEKDKFWGLIEEFRETILYILKDAEVIYFKHNPEKVPPVEKTKIFLGTLKKIAKSKTKSNNEILMWNKAIEQLNRIFELGLI